MAFNLEVQPQETLPPVPPQSTREEEIRRIQAEADRDAQARQAQEVDEKRQIEAEADKDAYEQDPLGGEIGEVLPRPRTVSTLPPEEAFKGAPYYKKKTEIRYVSQEEYDRIMAEREREAIEAEADRDMVAGFDPSIPRIGPVEGTIPRYGEIPEYLPQVEQPTGVRGTGVGEMLRVQYGLLPKEPAPTELPSPKYWKEKPAWSKDPVINEIGNQVGDLAANAVIYGQLFPNFFVLYESMSEIQNMIASKVKKEGYSPLKRQQISEEIEDPDLRALLGLGEEGVKFFISGLALNKIPQAMNSIHAEKMGRLAKKIGVDPIAVETQVDKWKKAGSGMSIQNEWRRLRDFGKGKRSFEESIAKQKAMPTRVVEPVPEAKPGVPGTEIRVSTDVATGDTVIKIPQRQPTVAKTEFVPPTKLTGEIKEPPTVPEPPELAPEKLAEKTLAEKPTVAEARPTKPTREKDPLYEILDREVGKIKPSPDYPDLAKLLPGRISKEGMAMDDAARIVNRDMGRVEDADSLYKEIQSSSKLKGKERVLEKPPEVTEREAREYNKSQKIIDTTERYVREELGKAKELEKVASTPKADPSKNPLVKEVRLPSVSPPEKLAFEQKVEKLEKMRADLREGTASPKPRTIKKGYEELDRPLSEEELYLNEERYADRVLKKSAGNVKEILKDLKAVGVREEIVQSVRNSRIVDGHMLESIKHFKREPKTGAISGVMTNKFEGYLRQIYQGSSEGGGGGTGGIKKYTEGFFDDSGFARLTRGLMVPQVAFEHMGIKPLYDWYRGGERNYHTLKARVIKESNVVYKKLGLTKKDLKDITKLNMTRQGKWEDMRIEGLDGVDIGDLSPAAQKRWRWEQRFFRKTEPEIEKQAKMVGVPLKKLKNYAPLYGKKGVKAAKKVEVPGLGHDDIFFGSILERVPHASINDYEMNSRKTFEAFVDGYARFTKVGERAGPLKYIFESPEFKRVLGEKDFDYANKWLDHAISPPPSPKALRLARRASYSTYLGIRPTTVGKQFISWVDAMLLERIGNPLRSEFWKEVGKMKVASVGERDIEVGVVDLNNKWDRIMLWAVRKADKFLAGDAMTKMLVGQLQTWKNAGKELGPKSLRTALRETSDRLDLIMMGSTPAQRPEWFRTEWGKLGLQFQSTITSRANAYFEKATGAKDNKDLLAIAKIIGAFVAGGFLESTIQDLRIKKMWEKEDLVDILKSTGGNIPLLGTLIFAFNRGEWTPTPFVQTVNDTLTAIKKMAENFGLKEIADTLLTLGQIIGLPRQVKQTIDGISITSGEGKRVSRNKYIAIDKLDEKIRAWVKGQYGPREIKEYFKDKALKTRLNKRVARIFASSKNKALLNKITTMTKKPFWGTDGDAFMRHAKSLGFKDFRTIFNIRRRAKKEEIELNPTTILYYIKEYLK